SIQPPVEHSDGEDGEEGKMELPLEARASISEKENSYVLYIQENDTRDFLAEMDDELK
ncbi:MAG: hypothetical protein GWN18_10195, partial [Thermoplasmata archaeon]|nr:hypothetical protein [Thermoplasmata archaeon]NIT77678.1 hypothetical protein [Thermoplasmata archaeon]NIU49423.1 hypothetical protein [Thermoplasmata archaeon]NIV79092.1 hypothetical protein [Thermoplasmata archaeon]NIW82919.1 hypothetical protein [Thermoplasmata archaeon]